MFKYKIAELANRPKGTIVKLSPIDVRVGTVISYQRLLNAYLRELAAETRRSVLPAFEADKRFRRTRDSLVVDSESWFAALKSKEEEIRSSVVNQATNIFRLEAQKNTDQFMTNARKALGVDLTAVVHQEDLESILKDYADSNASLIKSLGEDTVKKVEQSVYAAKLNGMSSASLSKTFQNQFGISQNRANLIASDQLNKLNSDFNRARQEQAGIEKYEWLTSKDERVRSRHRSLQGKIYKLKEATGAEEGLPPGKPIRCRCLQIPIIEFGATAVEEVPVKPAPIKSVSKVDEPIFEEVIVRPATTISRSTGTTLAEKIPPRPANRLATRPTFQPNFEDGREVLKVSGKAYMPDKVSNRDDNLIQVTIRTDFLEENWSRNTIDYIGKDDKGIVSAGKGPDGEILRDKDGNPVKLSRKDWFKRWMQENPSIPIETPIISVDKTGLVDFTNGRHRTSVLMHEEKVSNMVVTIHKDDLENAKEYLGAVHVKGKLKAKGVPSVKPVAAETAIKKVNIEYYGEENEKDAESRFNINEKFIQGGKIEGSKRSSEIMSAISDDFSELLISKNSSDQIVGALSFSEEDGVFEIGHLGSVEKGVGKELIVRFLETIIERDFETVQFSSLPGAHGFYQKLGFTPADGEIVDETKQIIFENSKSDVSKILKKVK